MSRQFTTPIILPANPVDPMEAVPKQYVDNKAFKVLDEGTLLPIRDKINFIGQRVNVTDDAFVDLASVVTIDPNIATYRGAWSAANTYYQYDMVNRYSAIFIYTSSAPLTGGNGPGTNASGWIPYSVAPNMTTAERTAWTIPNANGHLCYDTTLDALFIRDNSVWRQLSGLTRWYASTNANTSAAVGPYDISALSITLSRPSGHLLKIMFHGNIVLSATGEGRLGINKDAGQIQLSAVQWSIAARALGMNAIVFDVADGSSHTYVPTLQRTQGTGNINLAAAAANPGVFIIEDLGPS